MPPEGKLEQLKKLVRTGQSRGYVLYDEIDGVLAPSRERVTELDTILSELARHAIEVIDDPRTEDSMPDDSFFDQEGNLGDLAPLRMYLREMLTLPHLTLEQEKVLTEQINRSGQGAEDAEKRLIEANLWIALGTAMHFMNRGLSPLDLIQEGNIGIMRAVREYNHLRQYRFSTYATWWAREAIRAAIRGLKDKNS